VQVIFQLPLGVHRIGFLEEKLGAEGHKMPLRDPTLNTENLLIRSFRALPHLRMRLK
jgi:hypothetical protein